MTIRELEVFFKENLYKKINNNDLDLYFSIYLNDKLGINSKNNDSFDFNIENILNDINRLKNQEPIQYVVEKAYFYNSYFSVSKNTLIPRPETEELIELISHDLSFNDSFNGIDLGTGSGCIPIILKKLFKNSHWSALDISNEALKIARINAMSHQMDIDFIQGDLLKNISVSKKFDIIVSNPPYVRNLEKNEMNKSVLEYEPHLALFVSDEDPLIFYRRIIDFSIHHLSKNGSIYCEINQFLGIETFNLFKKYFHDVMLFKDISGNDRIIRSKNSIF